MKITSLMPARAWCGVALILAGAVLTDAGAGLLLGYAFAFSGVFLITLAAKEVTK